MNRWILKPQVKRCIFICMKKLNILVHRVMHFSHRYFIKIKSNLNNLHISFCNKYTIQPKIWGHLTITAMCAGSTHLSKMSLSFTGTGTEVEEVKCTTHSPDLNPFKQLWDELEHRLHSRHQYLTSVMHPKNSYSYALNSSVINLSRRMEVIVHMGLIVTCLLAIYCVWSLIVQKNHFMTFFILSNYFLRYSRCHLTSCW